MNSVNIIGNITRDPEVRVTSKGTEIATFSIAYNKKYKDATGQAKETVSYFDCKAFSGTARLIEQYFCKGKKIGLTGELQQESWEDKATGNKRSKVVIVVASIDFIDGGGSSSGGRSGEKSSPSQGDDEGLGYEPNDDDIPF